MRRPGGITEANRSLLEELHRGASGPFTAQEAAGVLGLDQPSARRLLAYLAARGWLSRVRHGLYTTVPLGTKAPAEWREDPWVVAAHLFAPCYIGGWSAAEHWHLTEQIFRAVVVFTSSKVRSSTVSVQGTPFRLKSMPPSRHFGTRPVWRGQTKIPVSDPSRTLVDVLGDPRVGGGIRHVADLVRAYFESEHRDDAALVAYARRLGNRAVFKRLGFLIEVLHVSAPELVDQCLRMRSAGLSALDPSIPSRGRILKRWNLRINSQISPSEERT